MSSVVENPVGSRGTAKYTAESREYTRSFLVTVDAAPTYSNAEVLAISGLPAIGDAHPQNASAYCMELGPPEAVDPASLLVWNVKAAYRTLTAGQNEPPGGDPWNDAWTVRYDSEGFEEAVAKDYLGVAIVNSAGDLFDPPIVRNRYYQHLTIGRKTLSYDPIFAADYVGAVNSVAVNILGRIWPKRMVLLKKWAGEWSLRNGVVYWNETIELIFNKDISEGGWGWDKRILDTGLNAVPAAGGTKRRIMTGDQDSTEPQRLDGAGLVNPVGAPDAYLVFRAFDEMDLSVLGLAL